MKKNNMQEIECVKRKKGTGERRPSLDGDFEGLVGDLFLLLSLLFHEELGVLGSGVVDAALGLGLALPSAGTLVFTLSNGLGGVPVADGLVAPVEKGVVSKVAAVDVLLDLVEVPVGERVDLDETGLVDLDDVHVAALSALAAAAAGKHSSDTKLAVGTLSGLDLGQPVVELVVGLPQLLAVLSGKLGSGVAALRLVDVKGEMGVVLLDSVTEINGLLEMVQGVEEDEIYLLVAGDIKLGEHIQDNESGQTEGGRLEKAGQRGNTPLEDLYSLLVRKALLILI